MRRVASYGGPSGVPASQRLKHKLAETAGMRVFSDRLSQEQGFLAPLAEEEDGRVLHSTSWATRNFFSTASTLKKFVKGSKFWGSTTKEPVVFAEEEKILGTTLSSDGAESSAGDQPQPETESSVQEAESDEAVSSVQTGMPPVTSESRDNASKNYSNLGGPRTNHKRSASDPADLVQSTFLTNWNASVLSDSQNNGPRQLDTLGGERQICFDMPQQGVEGGIQRSILYPAADILIGSNKNTYSLGAIPSTEVGTDPPVNSEHTGLTKVCTPHESCSLTLQSRSNTVQTSDADYLVEDLNPESAETTLGARCAAALKIQCCYRQWVTRKRYMLLRETTRKLQALYRAKKAQEDYQSLRRKVALCQRLWRRRRSFWMHLSALAVEAVRLQSVQHRSAMVIQSCWRAHVQKLAFCKLIQLQKAENEAARIIQKRWKHFHQICVEEHKSTIRVRAAVVIQAFVRGRSARSFVLIQNHSAVIIQREWRAHRHRFSSAAAVKLQRWWRGYKLQLSDRAYFQKCKLAAISLQCMWRTWVARRSLLYLQMEKSVKMKAVTSLQAYVRGRSVRHLVLKQHNAASIIQRCWHNHRFKQQYHAAIIIQTWWRGFVCRKRVHSMLCLGWPDQDIVAGRDSGSFCVSAVSVLERLDVGTGENSSIRVHEGSEHVSQSSFLTQSVDGSSIKGMPARPEVELEYCDSDEVYSYEMIEDIFSKGPSVSLPSSPIWDTSSVVRASEPVLEVAPHVSTNDLNLEACCKENITSDNTLSTHEDWNDVQIDRLDECLDTCLAALKPFPIVSSIELDEKISQTASTVRTNEITDGAVNEVGKAATSGHLAHTGDSSRSCVNASCQPGCFKGASGKEDHQPCAKMTDSENPVEIPTPEVEKKFRKQPSGLHQLNLHRNEERLQHFARVFLLQRQIAHQQLRAQLAPPFPPPHGILAPDLDGQDMPDIGMKAVSQGGYLGEAGAVEATEAEDSVEVPTCCAHLQSLQGQDPQSRGDIEDFSNRTASSDPSVISGASSILVHSTTINASSKRAGVELPVVSSHNLGSRTAGSDVVVDMTELLKQLDDVYGASKPHAEYLTSPVLLSKETVVYIGDDEETHDRTRKAAFGLKRDSALLTDVVGTKRLGMPDVNAMLVILVAMVVYTRTILRSSFLRTKESQRK